MTDVDTRTTPAPEPKHSRQAGLPHSRAMRFRPPRFRSPRSLRDDQLLRNGHLLTLSSTATAAIGMLYWAGAARSYGAETMGRSYAAVSALTFLAGIGQLNLNNVLIRFVPAAGERLRRLVLRCYAGALLATTLAAVAFVFLVPALAPGLAFLRTPAIGAVFVLGAVAYAVFALQDGVLTGLRRPWWLLTENAIFALAKFGLLLALAGTVLRGQAILLSWTATLLAVVAGTNALIFSRLIKRERAHAPERPDAVTSPRLQYVAADYTGELLWMATMNLPPIIVLNLTGARQSAYYALAWMITHGMYMLSMNMGSSLVVESSRDSERIARFRHVLRHTGVLLAACVAVVVLGAPAILRIFGAGYAAGGANLLRLMALSALPNLVIVTAVSVARARQRMARVVLIYAALSLLVLGLTCALVPVIGINGVGVAWLAGSTAVAATLSLRSELWTARPGHAKRFKKPDFSPSTLGPDHGRPAGEPRQPSLSVVVCAYTMDRWSDINKAIDSLHAQSHRPAEIILVVDHSAELAARARRELRGVRVIENAERRGLSGARNTGVRAAGGDVVAFLDDDAAAEPDWALRLLEPYANAATLGVGGRVEPVWERGRPAWFPHEFDWVVGCSYRGMPQRARAVRNFIGANMSFRREVLDRLGGFRHDLGRVGTRPLGGEETELCIRAARSHRDGHMLYAPDAVVHHHVPGARGTWSYFKARCYAEGLSKAAVREYSGSDAALASERGYLGSTIPSALLRPLRRGSRRTAWATAAALLVGVGWTIAGYCAGRAGIVAGKLRAPVASRKTATSPLAARTARTGALSALPAALALWIYSLRGVRLSAISDLGLITAVPVTFWAALAVLTAGFALTVYARARLNRHLAAGYVLALIAMLHATPAITYPALRYAWAWKHVAIVDLFSAHGAVPNLPSTDPMAAYSQWPGFFALNALITQLTGAHSAGSYAAWAPPVFNALLMIPLLLLYRTITSRRRLVWTGIWFYYAASWVGQDYFAPQAFVFVLYTTFLVVLIRALRRVRGGGAAVRGPELALLLLIAAAIDSSHQLTPVILVIMVAAFASLRRYRRALLPLLGGLVLLLAVWDGVVARQFMVTNLHSLVQALGALDANLGSGFIGLGSVSRDQALIAWIDRGLTAFVFALAVAALIRRPRLRRSAAAGLALCPLLLGGLGNYGGEMIFRIYLFALPGLALLAAAIVLAPARGGPRRGSLVTLIRLTIRRALLPLVSTALLAGLVFSYYGK
ncbi:MAG TPA: glycosyltransferase [Actinocrinis sp.]|nr:glycosyltransferase [Actinocrinis sp.]